MQWIKKGKNVEAKIGDDSLAKGEFSLWINGSGKLMNASSNHTSKKEMKTFLEYNSIFFRSRNSSSSSSQYPMPPQQQQQQHQYYHQHISKSKRSKSMDDFGSQMVFEQSNRIQRNNIRNESSYHNSPLSSQMAKKSPSNIMMTRMSNQFPAQPQHRNQLRYSVDNLLEIDTSYFNNYQVKTFDNLCHLRCECKSLLVTHKL